MAWINDKTYNSDALVQSDQRDLQIETHVKKIKGPLSLRIVEFYNNKTGQLIVSCKTQWCWVNPASRKPMNVPTQIQDLFLKEKASF